MGPQPVQSCPEPTTKGHPQADILAHLSAEGRGRDSAPITLRSLTESFHGVAGVVGMHGGLPPPDVFPFRTLGFSTDDMAVTIEDEKALVAAQQYAVATPRGYPPLLRWAEGQVQHLHSPPAQQHDVIITNGSNSALEAVLALLLDRGSPLLLEEYCYPTLLESVCVPKGYHPVPVPIDGQGLQPDALDEMLTGWQEEVRGCPRPWLLYAVPVGHNPSGATMTEARKRALYEVCRRHGVFILEDDAYWYLQYGNSTSSAARAGNGSQQQDASSVSPPAAAAAANGIGANGVHVASANGKPASGPVYEVPGAGPALGRSLLSLDTDGRVLRLDTFAKFLAPGLRVGWAAVPRAFAPKLVSQLMGSTLGPPSTSQVLVAELLGAWGEAGLQAHVSRVQRFYGARAQLLHRAATQHLTGLAEWQPPTAGMFLWARLLGVETVEDIWDDLVQEKVVVVPGRIAHPRASDPTFKCPWVRISFANATDADLVEGIRRLANVLRRRQQQ